MPEQLRVFSKSLHVFFFLHWLQCWFLPRRGELFPNIRRPKISGSVNCSAEPLLKLARVEHFKHILRKPVSSEHHFGSGFFIDETFQCIENCSLPPRHIYIVRSIQKVHQIALANVCKCKNLFAGQTRYSQIAQIDYVDPLIHKTIQQHHLGQILVKEYKERSEILAGYTIRIRLY